MADQLKGTLFANTTLSTIRTSLQSAFINPIAGLSAGNNLGSVIGISGGAFGTGNSADTMAGKIKFDAAKFEALFTQDREAARRLLDADGADAAPRTASPPASPNLAKSFTQTGGLLQASIDGSGEQVKRLQDQIDRMNDRVDSRGGAAQEPVPGHGARDLAAAVGAVRPRGPQQPQRLAAVQLGRDPTGRPVRRLAPWTRSRRCGRRSRRAARRWCPPTSRRWRRPSGAWRARCRRPCGGCTWSSPTARPARAAGRRCSRSTSSGCPAGLDPALEVVALEGTRRLRARTLVAVTEEDADGGQWCLLPDDRVAYFLPLAAEPALHLPLPDAAEFLRILAATGGGEVVVAMGGVERLGPVAARDAGARPLTLVTRGTSPPFPFGNLPGRAATKRPSVRMVRRVDGRSTLRRMRAALASLALVALLALAAGCGGEDAAGGAAAPSSADSAAVEPVQAGDDGRAPDIEPTGAIWEALPGTCREDLDGLRRHLGQAGRRSWPPRRRPRSRSAQQKKIQRKLDALEMQYITHSNVCINDISDWSKAAHPLEELLGEAASTAADIDVQVMCEQPLQWKLSTLDSLLAGYEELGFVMSGETITHLSPRTCLMLDSLLAADDPAIPCLQQEMAQEAGARLPAGRRGAGVRGRHADPRGAPRRRLAERGEDAVLRHPARRHRGRGAGRREGRRRADRRLRAARDRAPAGVRLQGLQARRQARHRAGDEGIPVAAPGARASRGGAAHRRRRRRGGALVPAGGARVRRGAPGRGVAASASVGDPRAAPRRRGDAASRA